ncbi:hypothetical protein GTP45_24960, partial [Pseudoduganella sp. FT55W]
RPRPVAAAPLPPASAGRGLPAPMWLNISMSFAITLLVSCFGKVAPFYVAYTLHAAEWGAYVLPCAALGSAISQPAWTWVVLRAGRTVMLVAGAALLSVAAVCFWRFGEVLQVAVLAAFFIGASSSGMGMTLWAAFAGMVASHPGMSASKAYGWLTAALKVALACGGLGIGAALTRLDYRAAAGGLVELMSLPSAVAGLLIMLGLLLGRAGRFRHG